MAQIINVSLVGLFWLALWLMFNGLQWSNSPRPWVTGLMAVLAFWITIAQIIPGDQAFLLSWTVLAGAFILRTAPQFYETEDILVTKVTIWIMAIVLFGVAIAFGTGANHMTMHP